MVSLIFQIIPFYFFAWSRYFTVKSENLQWFTN